MYKTKIGNILKPKTPNGKIKNIFFYGLKKKLYICITLQREKNNVVIYQKY